MNKPTKNTGSQDRLSYRPHKSVSVNAEDGNVQLVLSYPLKSIRIHSHWHQLFKRFSHREFVPLDEMRTPTEDPNDLEFFLNGLVRKGFLERKGVPPLSDNPFVSVIIPVRNRPDDIEACLQSLQKLDYPNDSMEIIVVDDGSTDQTPDVVSGFPVRLIRLKQRWQAPYCRNLAAGQARGELLALIDSDCLADSGWLRELVPAFKDKTLGAVGGVVDSYYSKNGLDRYEKVKSSLSVSAQFRRSDKNDPFFYLPSCNFLVKRDMFLQLGGFNEKFVVGEDVDLCWRLRAHGCHIEYRPEGRVYHKHRNNLTAFCRRRFEYGTSEALLNRLHPEKIKQMVFPPLALSFWAGIILAVSLGQLFWLLFAAGAFISQCAKKLSKIRKSGTPVETSLLVLSVFRGNLAFFYHIAAFISRYYLLLSLILVPIAPAVSVVILLLHMLAATVEHVIKKPSLNPITFLFYFSLEQLSYQLGVWWGCFKNICFRPVNPKIVSKAAVRDMQ